MTTSTMATVAGSGRPATWTTSVEDAPVALAVRPAGPAGPGLLAVAGAAGLLSVRDLAGRPVATASASGGLLTLAWSPDGAVLAAGGPEGSYWWTAAGGLERLDTTGWCASLAWNEAGRLAVADGRSAAVFEAGPPDHTPVLCWDTPEVASTVSAVLWLRLGRELALAAYGGLHAFAAGRRGPVRELAYAGSLLVAAASPDGRWLVSGNQDASIHVWRRRDGAELEMSGLPRKVTRLAFDSSGRWLAANGSPDSTVWDFSGRGPGGTAPRLLAAHSDGATALAWHPRSALVATGGADGVVALWDVPGAVPGRALGPAWSSRTASGAPVTALAWTPGGDTIVVAAADGTLAAVAPADVNVEPPR